MGVILRDNLGEGNCESGIAARQWGVKFCSEASLAKAPVRLFSKDEVLRKVLRSERFIEDAY